MISKIVIKWIFTQVVERTLDKSCAYIVLAEDMYILDKNNPTNFNFLDYPLPAYLNISKFLV